MLHSYLIAISAKANFGLQKIFIFQKITFSQTYICMYVNIYIHLTKIKMNIKNKDNSSSKIIIRWKNLEISLQFIKKYIYISLGLTGRICNIYGISKIYMLKVYKQLHQVSTRDFSIIKHNGHISLNLKKIFSFPA